MAQEEEQWLAAFDVPEDVSIDVEVPAHIVHSPQNKNLADLYGTIGEYINIAYGYMREDLSSSAVIFGAADKVQLGVAKDNVRSSMFNIHEALVAAGPEAFPVPQEVLNAFVVLQLDWPLVVDDGGDEDNVDNA